MSLPSRMVWIKARRSASIPVCSPTRALCNSPCVTSSSANVIALQQWHRGGNSAPFLFSIRWKHWDREYGPASLLQSRVAHAEARPYMLVEQLNRGAVGHRVGLCQIFLGLYHEGLAVHVRGIR